MNGVCYQRYGKRLEQQKRYSHCLCLHCRRKFEIGTTIKSVFDYRFKSNNHTHIFLLNFNRNCDKFSGFWFRPVARISQQGDHKPQGWETFFKYNIGCRPMQQPGGQIGHGDTYFKLGKGTTGPFGDGPVFFVWIRVYFGVQSGFIWNHWMGALHVTVGHRHLPKNATNKCSHFALEGVYYITRAAGNVTFVGCSESVTTFSCSYIQSFVRNVTIWRLRKFTNIVGWKKFIIDNRIWVDKIASDFVLSWTFVQKLSLPDLTLIGTHL